MYQRVGGAVAWIGAFIWLCIPRFGPEFFRSFLYDRLLSIFHPYLVDFGPPLLLATVGAYLFWLSGGKSWRLQGKAVLVDRLAPMHEVIAHVATRIGDKNTSE